MKKAMIVTNSIDIQAPAARVWKALTDPSETEKYMFGCRTVSDWKKGSPLLWEGVHEGKKLVFVKGMISEIKPERRLVYTTIDPNSGIPDLPENYLSVSYDLVESGGTTRLTATQGDYARVGDGEKRYRETMEGGGWQPILVQIKKLLEER